MTGALLGANGLIVLLIALVTLVLPIWAVVDSISRPTGAFTAGWIVKGNVDRTNRGVLALHRNRRSRAFHCVFGFDSTAGKGRDDPLNSVLSELFRSR